MTDTELRELFDSLPEWKRTTPRGFRPGESYVCHRDWGEGYYALVICDPYPRGLWKIATECRGPNGFSKELGRGAVYLRTVEELKVHLSQLGGASYGHLKEARGTP